MLKNRKRNKCNNDLAMTQLEIYKRQLEIAKQMLENAKNNNMSSEDISMYERLCNLCESSIKKWIAANI